MTLSPTMSQVNDGPGHRGYHHHGGGANGQGNPQAQMAAMFADTRGANLRLLHRVVDVFSPAVASLLASAQVRFGVPDIASTFGDFRLGYGCSKHR